MGKGIGIKGLALAISALALASAMAANTGVSKQEVVKEPESVAAFGLRPSGERKVFGYVLDKPQVALTNGIKLIELAPAKISGEATVMEDGSASAKLSVEAKTDMGLLTIEIDAQGLEGVEFDAMFIVRGKPTQAHVRIAKAEGCVAKVCPGALRADFLDSEKSVSVDVYSPAKKD